MAGSTPPARPRRGSSTGIRAGGPTGLPRQAIPGRSGDVPPAVAVLSLTDRATDSALLEGLAVDDEAAAVAFVRRFQGSVYGMALSITRDASLAEDVSQEVFVRAWRAAGSYDTRKASVLTWLLAITRHAAIDAIRMRRPTVDADPLLDTLVLGVTDDVPEIALRHLEGEQARARLRLLPPEQARAVVLAAIGGCTAAEISQREGIPLGTAKTRIRSGLQKLRNAWEEHPYA